MVDKNIDSLHSEEVGKLIPDSADVHELDVSADMKRIDISLNERNKDKEEDFTKRETKDRLDTLAQSIGQKEESKSSSPTPPQWLTQGQYDTLKAISGSPEALAGRVASLERVESLESNLPSRLVNRANA